MELKYNALKLNENDNVAVALTNIKAGELLSIQGVDEKLKVEDAIAYGHKIATAYIGLEKKIIKYGECMGISTAEIHPGHHVHVFNVRGLNEEERLSSLKEHVVSM
ncbi:MAG: UxaA family hydrolase [Sporosarcina sp.]